MQRTISNTRTFLRNVQATKKLTQASVHRNSRTYQARNQPQEDCSQETSQRYKPEGVLQGVRQGPDKQPPGTSGSKCKQAVPRDRIIYPKLHLRNPSQSGNLHRS
ncbi:hypothetical protein PCANC_28107 [Puccinia coronata f. sp. avenae]|uniref:Uncharacterized protein n=1 Tax=Puccinia coronata f. sp. avenae TaxID=200324 RepID=A0A2N5TN39_9BASI|nr:hypothetical protein PCANC_28107 [Puccinia coronata f. sp. avenae]